MPETKDLKARLRFWSLFLGVLQIAIGCAVAMVPPDAVPWSRGLVMAHLEYAANGVMMIALGLLLPELGLGQLGLKVWFGLLQVGTWLNGLAGILGAVSGHASKFLPLANAARPAPNGPDHPIVSVPLLIVGPTILACFVLTLVGLWKGRTA